MPAPFLHSLLPGHFFWVSVFLHFIFLNNRGDHIFVLFLAQIGCLIFLYNLSFANILLVRFYYIKEMYAAIFLTFSWFLCIEGDQISLLQLMFEKDKFSKTTREWHIRDKQGEFSKLQNCTRWIPQLRTFSIFLRAALPSACWPVLTSLMAPLDFGYLLDLAKTELL